MAKLNKRPKLVVGKEYLINDRNNGWVLATYLGRQNFSECMVCGRGENVHTFNIYHNEEKTDYETWTFGTTHLPEMKEVK